MPSFEEKLDKIAEDTAYMRGKWEATIPPLVNEIIEHRKTIGKITTQQARAREKFAMMGMFSGAIGTGVVEWITRHVHF